MEDFVPYKLAVKLREKGFDWETREIYERNTLACRYEDYPKPTISQVLKWLREEKDIYINLISFHTFANKNEVAFAWCIRVKIDGEWRNIEENSSYSTYEECAISAIKDVFDNNLI